MFRFFSKLWKWFLGLFWKKSATMPAVELSLFPVYRLQPGEKADPAYYVLTFSGTHLISVTEQIPDNKVDGGYEFWCVLKKPFELLLHFSITKNLNSEVPVTVEINPHVFCPVNLGYEGGITFDELKKLIEIRLDGFFQNVGIEADQLPHFTAEQFELVCKKFSSCEESTGISLISMGPAMIQECYSADEINENNKKIEQELNSIQKPEEWQDFVKKVLPGEQSNSEEVAALGEAFLGNKTTSAECIVTLHEMEQAAVVKEEDCIGHAYWAGVIQNLRKQEHFREQEPEVAVTRRTSEPFNVIPSVSHRPLLGIFTSYVTQDARLLEYLTGKCVLIENILSEHFAEAKDIQIATSIRELKNKLYNIQCMLRNMPTLNSKLAVARVSRETMLRMLKAMNLAINAAEYLEAATNVAGVFDSYPLPGELSSAMGVLFRQVEIRNQGK